MTYFADLEKLRPNLEAIPVEEVMAPNLPAEKAASEALVLFNTANKDKARLQAAGLDWLCVEELPLRASAFTAAETKWFTDRGATKESMAAWRAKSPAAYQLHEELLHDFGYAFRNDGTLLAKVSEIAEGSGDDDMIADLLKCAVLGRAHEAELAAIRFDTVKLDQAEEVASEMSKLLAAATADKSTASASQDLRDRAFTHLKKAVDEVRKCGQYVFWKEDRARDYASNYFRGIRRAAARRAAQKAQPTQ